MVKTGHWISFGLMGLGTLVIQSGLGRLVGLGPQRIMPDLLLILAVLMAFRCEDSRSLVGCWVLGLCKDLSSDAALGSYALCFGLLGIAIFYLRNWFYGNNWISAMVVTFLGSLLVEQSVYLIGIFKGGLSWELWGGSSMEMLFSAGFTAALAPYGQWILSKLPGLWGRQLKGAPGE